MFFIELRAHELKDRSSLPGGKIAAIVIAVIVVLIILTIIAVLVYRWRKKKRGGVSGGAQTVDDTKENKVDPDEAIQPAPVVVGEMAYGSQAANPHSEADTAIHRPTVINPTPA